MTKTILLGAMLALIFVVSMAVSASAVAHLVIDKVEAKTDGDTSKVEVTTMGNFEGGPGAFGLGAFGTTGVIAVTTHGGVGPDSEAQVNADDPVFHTHVVIPTFTPACVTLTNTDGLAIGSASFEEVGDLEVEGSKIEIKNIPLASVGELNGDVITFNLRPLGTLPLPDHICIDVSNSASTLD